MIKTIRMLAVCAVACVAIQAQQKAVRNLTGTWRIQFQDDNGGSASTPKLVLQQAGDKLTGTFGKFDWPVIGTVDGKTILFTFIAHGGAGATASSDTVFYWGTIDEKGAMKGRMKNPKEAGDWVASRE